ncbi:MAG: hypothetical protein AB9835_10150 [Eubacteriales bacterium]
MKSSKITLLLIMLLLATNVFLILNIAAVERTKNTLPERMLTDAVQLLERSGIIIDPQAIPNVRPSTPIYEGAMSDTELTSFAELFSGAETDTVYQPLPGLRMYFSAGGYVFEFSEKQLSFSLYRQDEELSEQVEALLDGVSGKLDNMSGKSDNMSDKSDGLSDKSDEISDKKLIKQAGKEIKALFVRNGDISAQAEVTGCVSLDGGYVATVRRLTKGLAVDGQEMRVYIRDGIVAAARGSWYFGEYVDENSMPYMDSVNILFKAKDLGEEFSGIIKEMKLNYNVIWHQVDRFYLIPSWKVVFGDGREYNFNALTGDLIS